jgi:hypothetical protein
MFGITVVISVGYSAFFGLAAGGISLSDMTCKAGYLCVGIVVLIHLLERYNRHVADQQVFLEFD